MRFREAEGAEPEFQMAPMIDIVFLLLTFFIFAGAFKPQETELAVNLPVEVAEGEVQAEMPDVIAIFVMQDGGVSVNDREYDSPGCEDLPELCDLLLRVREAFGRKQQVIIDAHAEAKYQRVVDVLNICRYAGIENVSFYGG